MIFIIGGACQGKRDFARGLFGLSYEEWERGVADGEKDLPELAWEKPYLTSFHQWVRQILAQGEDPAGFVEKVLGAAPEVVVMEEVGCGVVPIERRDRELREAVGRAGQALAARAQQVYRVVCGIPMRLK